MDSIPHNEMESSATTLQTTATTTLLSVSLSSSTSPSSSTSSRYENQKRRDWNTFGQYLKNHRPPLALSCCSGAHVLEFLRYLDQFGKTKVHTPICPFYGHPNPPAPCPCPLRQAWGSLDAHVGRLRAAFEENGGKPEANPLCAPAVRLYLREVCDLQSKARGISYEKKKRKRPPPQQQQTLFNPKTSLDSMTMNNHQQQPPEPPQLTASGGDCGNCGAHLRGLLHNVRLHGIQRKLCTSCVLRLHPSSFCPVCFAFYDSKPPHPSKRFACSKCASFTHSLCASKPLPSPYLCPPCSAPSPSSFTFFSNGAYAGGGRRIDGKSVAVILCAARIASASMAKAEAVVWIEAEKKAKNAAFARKRAWEALERVALLITKNNVNADQNNNGGGDGSAQLSGSAASFFNAIKKQNVNVSQELVNNGKTETG